VRVLVAGAGALGSVIGGLLRRAGHDVTLLGRDPHVAAIAASGLEIDGLWGRHHVTGFGLATTPTGLAGPYDAILVTVKAYDTCRAAAETVAALAPTGVMISLQNGLGNVETLREVAGPDRALGGRVIFGTELTAPGCVRVTVYADRVLLGAVGGHGEETTERAREWAERLDAAGIPAAHCGDITAALWGKVLYNAALNPLGALLGVHYGALGEHSHTREIMDRVIVETFAVAMAEQVQLPWASAAAYREIFYDRLLPSTYRHRSSMLQDLERGRRTEIDALNGAVWARGGARGIETPANEMLTCLVHAREEMRAGGRG
jgi:2-dehydropantoate 2-reductase